MTTTLYCPVPYSGVISQGYTVTQTGTPVPDNLVQAIMSAAYTAGVVLTTSAGGTPAVVQSTSWFNAGTGAPTSGSWSAGMEVRDSTGAEFVCTVSGTPGTWVAVSGGGGGALPTQTGNAHKLLGTDGTSATWKAAPVIDAADYGVVGDNSTVNTTALQAALDASPYPVSGLAGNDVPARIVQLPPGRIKTSTLVIPANVWLRGHGPSGSYLVSSAGATADLLTLAAGAVQVTISDLGIIGNGSATAGSSINLANTSAASILGDSRHVVRNVVIVSGFHGVTSSGHTEERLDSVTVQRPLGRGFNLTSTDMFITNCTVGQPAGDFGILLNGANSRMWGCKVYGGTTSSAHFGIGGAGRHEVTNCESQDAAGVGFSISSNDPSVVSNCLTDSCGGYGLSVDFDSGASRIVNHHVVARSGGAFTPSAGLMVRSSNSSVHLTTKGAFPAVSTNSTFGNGEQLQINNDTGVQLVSYASSVTVDPYKGGTVYVGTLTGNITVANPAAADGSPLHYNQRLRLIFTQDATGGRTVTWGSKLLAGSGSVNTAASASTIIDFAYDPVADKWRQAGSAGALLASNNLSDVASTSTALANLGADTKYQPFSSAQPWKPGTRFGPNLWATTNFSSVTNGSVGTLNTSSLTPSLTANSTHNTLTTRVLLPLNGNNAPQRYRLTYTATSTAVSGGGNLHLRVNPTASTGSTISGFSTITLADVGSSAVALNGFRSSYEIDISGPSADGTRAVYLDVILDTDNTASAGTISLANVSLYRIGATVPAIRMCWTAAPSSSASLFVEMPIGTTTDGLLMRARQQFTADNALELGLTTLGVYPDAALQNVNYLNTSGPYLGSPQPQQSNAHTNNSGQILSVTRTDTALELRGNTHGGETGRTGTYGTDFAVFADYADGNGWTAVTDNSWWHYCWRVKIVATTKMTRSDQAGTPFANVDSTYYLYADGTIRKSQTTTFLTTQTLDKWFWHMTSFDPASGRGAYRGCIGRGASKLVDTDWRAVLAPPTLTGAPAGSTTGGTLTASTRNYRVTALSASGETTGSTSDGRVTLTGTTASAVVTWNAVTGAVAYNVYGGLQGEERFLAQIAAGTVTYTDTGAAIPGAGLPRKNTALTGLTQTTMVSRDDCDWTALQERVTGYVYGMLADRDTVLSLPGVAGFRADIQRQDAGLGKNYWILLFSGSDTPQTINSGAVFSGEVWWTHYMPADPTLYYAEQAAKAAAIKALPALYPIA